MLADENATLKKAIAESVLETIKYKKALACRASLVHPHERREEVGGIAVVICENVSLYCRIMLFHFRIDSDQIRPRP